MSFTYIANEEKSWNHSVTNKKSWFTTKMPILLSRWNKQLTNHLFQLSDRTQRPTLRCHRQEMSGEFGGFCCVFGFPCCFTPGTGGSWRWASASAQSQSHEPGAQFWQVCCCLRGSRKKPEWVLEDFSPWFMVQWKIDRIVVFWKVTIYYWRQTHFTEPWLWGGRVAFGMVFENFKKSWKLFQAGILSCLLLKR